MMWHNSFLVSLLTFQPTLLPTNKTTHQDKKKTLYGGELSWWEVVQIRSHLVLVLLNTAQTLPVGCYTAQM